MSSLRQNLAAGASWAASAAKLTINAEFHYDQAGFDHTGWHRWFAAAGTSPAVADELWYIRAFALEPTGFAFVSLIDGSSVRRLAP